MLWDDLSDHLVVVDLADMRWLERPRALEPTSVNTRHGHRLRAGKTGKGSCAAQLLSTHEADLGSASGETESPKASRAADYLYSMLVGGCKTVLSVNQCQDKMTKNNGSKFEVDYSSSAS